MTTDLTEPRKHLSSQKRWYTQALFVALCVSTAACGAAPSMAGMAPSSPRGAADVAPSMMASSAPAPMAEGVVGAAPQAPGEAPRPGVEPARIDASQGPMLIYRATIQLAVDDVGTRIRQIEELAQKSGGFLAKRDDLSITIRVPQGHFPEALQSITKLGDVLHRDASAEDVTEEFADLDVRLKNAHATRARLEQLLAKANTVADTLTVERELSRVAGEIERLEGRMKFLRDRAAYSTITVNLEKRAAVVVQPRRKDGAVQLPFPWLSDLGIDRLRSF